ncbi:hypothetical protein CAPTEDRAFT_208965 [Capitella teleta]|uniref:CARD domain-containing protein n=1 Tax=Capitella teleta TaxID=283909 RepID=R7TVN3_CAPTE|nr:hypothetical protein CAPTEDRAFT_208965 [Capitella teleta]|eukprot:ELT97647.1 hypothetical protein CAPTEDRAFT_208965 [Capitella teleta]
MTILSKPRRELLQKKRVGLVKSISLENGLWDLMESSGLVSKSIRDRFKLNSTPDEQVGKLLDYLGKRTEEDYVTFGKCLNADNQSHVTKMLGIKQQGRKTIGAIGECILRELRGLPGIKVGGHNINNSRYADDTVLIASSEADLQHLLDIVDRESENVGLRLNTKNPVDNHGHLQKGKHTNMQFEAEGLHTGSALNNTHFGENHTFANKKLRKSQFSLSYQYDRHNTHCDYRGYVV